MQALENVPAMEHPDLLEGFDRFSDAGVFRLRDDLAVVQTVDFFPPIVNDATWFGRIAAANSLSDVYAMGGTPVTALSIVGFPSRDVDMAILGEILAAGAAKVLEAGAVLVGGHSVMDSEIKYGLAVTGTVHPEQLVRNSGARTGDHLVLTKPIGMGAVSTALKMEKIDEASIEKASEVMATLNRDASEAMLALGVHGATDITGFGLLGHARELAEASGVTVRLRAAEIPVFPGARELAGRRLLSGGAARNREFLGNRVRVDPRVPEDLTGLLYDSETSGGLLVALPPEGAARLVEDLRARGHADTSIVGEVEDAGERPVEVV